MTHGSASKALATSPLVQLGPKLTGSEESGEGYFGRDVVLSADGETALVGAPHEGGEAGAVWVFTRSGSTWTQQAKLTGGEEAVGEGHFGHSVALSADGDTAVIGAPNDDDSLGAVWVFTRSGSTWTQQAKLTGVGESDGGQFGAGVALSSEGDTAVIGAPTDDHSLGSMWVFTRSGSTWTQQGSKLEGGEESGPGELGRGVALSSDGNTALVGAPHDSDGVGAVWVFSRSGSTWTQQGSKLTGGEEVGEVRFGRSVALSADGDTALVGGRYDNGMIGAAWVFTRSGSTWTQQGAKLTAASGEIGAGELGYSVALAADGDTALIGGPRDHGYIGAVWVFARSGSTWVQQGEELVGAEESGNGWFGSSVALSADAGTALIGGLGDSGKAGAAWVFGIPSSQPEPQPTGETQPGSSDPQTQPATGSSPGTSSPTAKHGVAAYKAVGGGVVLLSRTVHVQSGRARVRLRCTAPVACRARLTLVVAVRAQAARRSRAIAIATALFSIPRGATKTVKLTLRAAGRSRLSAGRGRLNARLAIHVLAPDPSGRTRTRTYAVKLVLLLGRRARRSAKQPLPHQQPLPHRARGVASASSPSRVHPHPLLLRLPLRAGAGAERIETVAL